MTISGLRFSDSFNNGIAVFVPGDADRTVRVELRDTVIQGAKFHGLFLDDQASSGFNTDDVPHDACLDPNPSASNASFHLVLRRSSVVDNGTLRGVSMTARRPGAQGTSMAFVSTRAPPVGSGPNSSMST